MNKVKVIPTLIQNRIQSRSSLYFSQTPRLDNVFYQMRTTAWILLIGIWVIGGLQGCVTLQKKPSEELYGPPPSQVIPEMQSTGTPDSSFGAVGPFPDQQGPTPIAAKPVVLVLGPGLARGFAHVGVIRALHEAKIPIGAIYGAEMGGLIGSLYAMSMNLNQFEWSLLKFKEDAFDTRGGFFNRLGSHSNKQLIFETRLNEVFHKRDLSQARIPIYLAQSPTKKSDSTSDFHPIVNHGNAAYVIRDSMQEALMNKSSSGMRDWSQAVSQMCKEAKALGLGPVVFVDVSTAAAKDQVANDCADVRLIIRPKLRGISVRDFGKRTEAAYQGKIGVSESLNELKMDLSKITKD